jgi:hypothetical protein
LRRPQPLLSRAAAATAAARRKSLRESCEGGGDGGEEMWVVDAKVDVDIDIDGVDYNVNDDCVVFVVE